MAKTFKRVVFNGRFDIQFTHDQTFQFSWFGTLREIDNKLDELYVTWKEEKSTALRKPLDEEHQHGSTTDFCGNDFNIFLSFSEIILR